jgi:hypothetical protein
MRRAVKAIASGLPPMIAVGWCLGEPVVLQRYARGHERIIGDVHRGDLCPNRMRLWSGMLVKLVF